jgi:ankyrin repeat protein
VIAHRGTNPTKLGALKADLNGVVQNHYVPQIDSASTFAHKVVEVLQAVSQKNGVSFQLFFTGHSLGGWLAQITTFTTEYLATKNNIFLKNDNEQDCYHPHTVVFESPGCKNMLSVMADNLDVRLEGRSIELEQLDITSYLSAPNLINTCNPHVGTVFRIFTDLSDMRWWEEITEMYTLATHSMQKIVEAFDPVTGQVRKDEQGKLKVHVVVDWPVSYSLLGGEEYKSFFESAKHLNNYHPDIKDESFQTLQFSTIRYQTKLYDELVNSLHVFNQKEQEFLQFYLWLRQWPELFEPLKLFSVLENNQAKEHAKNILQSFEIGNNTVRCTDASPLQALIPYVKRLLQLFPETKEETKLALSSDGVRNRVYLFETRRYVERISRSPLEFSSDSLSFREFVQSDKQKVLHLQMVKGDEWTGLVKVQQVLQKTGCVSEGQYIVLKLERLLTLNQFMDLSKLMQSTVTPFLLLIACEDKKELDEETKDVIRTLFDTTKHKQNIKMIFITQSGESIVKFLHYLGSKLSGNEFVRRSEELTWSGLTTNSQEKLLEKSVNFQGAELSLNQLMSAGSPAAKSLPLTDLLEENKLKIADPVPISNGYNERYYIGRTFRYQTAIKQEILNDEDVRVSRIYLASSEQEYNKLCQLNPNNNVHWLEKDKEGNLRWQQSQGSLETVRRYIDTDRSHTYTEDELVKLLEQAEQQRVMLISDTAGMGKSTVLTHLSKIIKRTSPTKWVVRINLNDHTDVLKGLKIGQNDTEKAIEFVSESLLKLKPGFDRELFKQCCEQKQKVRIVIMLDGFDEISPFYKETGIGLLEALRKTAVEQLWVTTRPHLVDELEDTLQQLSYQLDPFSEENQVEFLTKFWSLKYSVTDVEINLKLENYAELLINGIGNSISDKDKQFTGIPLLTRLLAEAFEEEVQMFYDSAESIPQLPFQLDMIGLYRRFIERKYDIYQEEKLQENVDNVGAKEQRDRNLKIMRQEHQRLAMKVLFTEEQAALFENNRESLFATEDLARIGIVQVSHGGKMNFIHRTFSEYYVADCLVTGLTEGKHTSQQVQDFVLNYILQNEEYQIIRAFINGLLSSSKPSKEMSKQYGTRIDDLGNDCLLHTAAFEGKANIIEFLVESVTAAGNKDTASRLLTEQDDLGRTAWYIAAEEGEINVMQKIWNLAEDILSKGMVKIILLATNSEGNSTWHAAAMRGKVDVLLEIWNLAKECLTTEEIKNNLLLATNSKGNTAWHLAVEWWVTKGAMQKIWDLARENLTTEELTNKFLLATNSEGNTVWHLAAEGSGRPDLMQKIWVLAKDNLTTVEIKTELLLATNNKGNTAWHLAAMRGKVDVLQEMWNLVKANLTTEEIKNNLLLGTNNEGDTAWHLAAMNGEVAVLKKIWDLAKDYLTTENMNSKLLLAITSEGNTVWHLAAISGKLALLQEVWDLAKNYLTKQEIKNKLLLATNSVGNTAWHLAAISGKVAVLQEIWVFAKDYLTTEEMKNNLLLSTNSKGNTAWHLAANGWLTQDALQKLWELAKDNLTKEEIKDKLLLAKNREGNTAWHLAAMSGKVAVLKEIWDLAKDYLTTEELNNKLLLATNSEGDTAQHYATMGRDTQNALQKILDLAKTI